MTIWSLLAFSLIVIGCMVLFIKVQYSRWGVAALYFCLVLIALKFPQEYMQAIIWSLGTFCYHKAHHSFLCFIFSNPMLVMEVTAGVIKVRIGMLLHGSFIWRVTTAAVYALLKLRRWAKLTLLIDCIAAVAFSDAWQVSAVTCKTLMLYCTTSVTMIQISADRNILLFM